MTFKYIIPFYFLLIPFILFSQEDFLNSHTINEELKEKANAVIRLQDEHIDIQSRRRLVHKYKSIITVLNKKGNDALDTRIYYSGKGQIREIQISVYDASGKMIKRIKNSDIKDVSAFDGVSLHSDDRLKYFEYTPISYPYTVQFKYTRITQNTAFIPRWYPLAQPYTSLEKGTFTVKYPEGAKIEIKEENLEANGIQNLSEGNILKYKAENIHAFKPEGSSPSMSNYIPKVWLSLHDFHLEGYDGNGGDWKSFGKWMYDKLLAGRKKLPEATKQEVIALVKGVDDPIEKARIVYQYMQDRTRYISVQLGIGGWMPMLASDVDKLGYGDCKALTNYTQALLHEVGVPTNYVVVYGGDEIFDIKKDFTGLQGNHAILNIPNNGNDIWLECTSQQVPFGYIANFTDDRDVLVISEEGGVIKHTKKYETKENAQYTTGSYTLHEDGSIAVTTEIKTGGTQYKIRNKITRESEKNQEAYYKNYWRNINNISLGEIKHSNDKKNVNFTETIAFNASSYGVISGERILFVPNALNQYGYVPNRYRNRKYPVEVQRGFFDEDNYKIQLPTNYTIEAIPEDIVLETKFGKYTRSIQKNEDGSLQYKRSLQKNEGYYPKEEYKSYRQFFKNIVKQDNAKVVLIKK